MACFYPVNAWKAQRLNESGKRGIVFNIREGFADMALQVPCGRCDGCRAERSQQWAIRMYHEAQLHDRNCFLTFTYADAPDALDKTHFQDFLKRARHHFSFRYFACGEYGEQTHRPHYHAIFFGEDFLDGAVEVNSELYTHPQLQELWGHGHIAIAPVSMATCCYVAGYVNKKIGDEDTFSLMSRRPGIGSGWLEKFADEIVRNGSVVVEGKELPIPQRYMKWKEDLLADVKRERKRIFDDLTPEQRFQRAKSLPAAEKHKKAQLKLRSKKL